MNPQKWLFKLIVKNLEYGKSLSDPAEIFIYETEQNTPKSFPVLLKHTANNTRK